MKDHIPLPLPFIPSWDVSGVVEAVGSGATTFKKGDEVYARRMSRLTVSALTRNTWW
jgi:NADPH:quinone reductase-like Zn-dependent oxidoreductase